VITELLLADLHIPDVNDDSTLVALEYASGRQIDILTLLGDFIDLYPVSSFPKDPTVSLLEEIEKAKDFRAFLDSIFQPSEKYFVIGNHERRLLRYLWTHAPKVSGLKEMNIHSLLGLEQSGYEIIDNMQLLSDTGQPFRIGKLYHLHGDELNVGAGALNIARLALRKTVESVIFGHFHRSDEAYGKGIDGTVRGAWAIGTLGPLSASFAQVNNWNHGFALVDYHDDGCFEVHNKKIINGRVV